MLQISPVLERDPCFESAPFTNVQRTTDVASQSDVYMIRAQRDKHMLYMTELSNVTDMVVVIMIKVKQNRL